MLYFSRWKVALVLGTCIAGLIFAAPNLLPSGFRDALPSWIPHQTVNLGLDLQGGSHLLLEVEVDAVIKERLEALVDETRIALRKARIGYTGLGIADGAVSVRVRDLTEIDKTVELLEGLAQPISASLLSLVPTQDLDVSADGEGKITLKQTQEAVIQRTNSALLQSIEIVRRRIDELGTREPTIQRQGEDRILVQVPGLESPDRLKALLGQTAKLTFRLVDMTITPGQALQARAPSGSEILYSEDDPPEPYVIRKRIIVSGERLVDSQPGFDSRNNEPIVTFRFDSVGAKQFGEATQVNVGRPFAIILDNKVISAPVIREPILGGTGQISGGFSVEEANDLSILLRAGALPAPLTVLEERTVGPGLGADSVRAGEIAAVIGMVGVVIFIFLAYGLFGVFANIALLTNLVIIMGALSLLQATLTLPGIAGIVLTIGMAVDANVLIFERIREEVASGKTPLNAVEVGYSRALNTILDANITTFIAAAILFQIGSGPVRGFAVTLAIGILTSVFTAFTFTRLMISTWLRLRRPAALPI